MNSIPGASREFGLPPHRRALALSNYRLSASVDGARPRGTSDGTMWPTMTAPATPPRAARGRTAAPGVAALVLFGLALGTAGCSYIFSETRTSHEYEPSYGVDSPDFRRSLDILGTD